LKILLDESVPKIVKNRLPDLSIETVQEMGWAGTKNGDLRLLADAQFDVFVTCDKSLRYQQNLASFKLAIVVLPTNNVRVIGRIMGLNSK
jgi:hypothetical protein